MENRRVSRRTALTGAAGAIAAGLAGCSGVLDGGSQGGGETYQVGYGDSQATVDSANFPTDEKLYVYAVQSGWSNWPAIMSAFEEQYGVPLNDDDRSSGEALTHMRSRAQNPDHSAYNGGYTYGIIAMNEGFTTDYKPANWDKVPKKLKTDNR